MKKADVFDYLSWRGDLTFAQSAFNEIDSLMTATASRNCTAFFSWANE